MSKDFRHLATIITFGAGKSERSIICMSNERTCTPISAEKMAEGIASFGYHAIVARQRRQA